MTKNDFNTSDDKSQNVLQAVTQAEQLLNCEPSTLGGLRILADLVNWRLAPAVSGWPPFNPEELELAAAALTALENSPDITGPAYMGAVRLIDAAERGLRGQIGRRYLLLLQAQVGELLKVEV